jgi:lipopolysaccharide transport system permease protein
MISKEAVETNASLKSEYMTNLNDIPVIEIKATTGWSSLKLKELWLYRELLYFFIWRDMKVRYKQTAIGAAWAIIQPFFSMVVFTLLFGGLAQMPSDGIPYPIFSFAALVPWTFFANGLTQASNSLVNNANMIKKIYFPRLTMPTAAVLAGLVDFVLAFSVLLLMMVCFDSSRTINIVWLPLFLLLAIITCLGASLWLSAMNVQFRDIRYVVPFLVQIWFFITPIVYSSSMLEQPWQTLYGINPMAGVIEGFRWALLGTTPPGPMTFVSVVVAVLLFGSGVLYFRRMEKTFADVI